MKSLSGVGLGLSVVFGCLLLALVGELYYLLWWKKRLAHRSIQERYCTASNGPAKDLLHIFCLKKPSPTVSQSALNQQEAYPHSSSSHDSENQSQVQSSDSGDGKDSLVKPLEQDTMESELMRLHKLAGPPRFLFTIVEETREDLLDSEDGRSRKGSRGRSLSDLLAAIDTPYLTPVASPSFFTPPLTPVESTYKQHGFNPLFELSSDAEFNRVRASPPPKFKFLQDAEEKLRRKMVVGEGQRSGSSHGQELSVSDRSELLKDEEDGSFITIVVDKNRGREDIRNTSPTTRPKHDGYQEKNIIGMLLDGFGSVSIFHGTSQRAAEEVKERKEGGNAEWDKILQNDGEREDKIGTRTEIAMEEHDKGLGERRQSGDLW